MKRKIFVAATAAAALALASAGALGHSGATGVVKQRMELMDNIGNAMKSLTAMMRGKETYDAARVRDLARLIGDHGGESMTGLFPEGSIMGPSEALPAIWTDWEHFSSLAGQISDYASALEAAAANERAAAGGGMMANQGMMGQGQGMMGGGQGMMMGQGSMMGQSQAGPSVEQLSTMPPDAAFMHLAQTCSACHQDFRKEK
jgi:cytochrome c556